MFGSLVKGKFKPNDVDIALLVKEKEIALVGEVKEFLGKRNVDIELVSLEEFYSTRIGLTLITEGFSVKRDKFLKDILGLKSKKIYIYNIKHLTQSHKVLFGRGLNFVLNKIKAVKLGAGSVMVPLESSGEFEDFLARWEMKYNVKEYNIFG